MKNLAVKNLAMKNLPMKNMTLENMARACGGRLYMKGADPAEVTGVVIDSRLVENGNLFIATRGERADGHDFIPQAAAGGAAGILCETPPDLEISYILVEDSLQALKDIAAFYRRQLTIPVIGITGSVGKTSTKEFIAAVLGEKYAVLKTEGNFNNEIGLPLTILRIRPCHQAAVLEMGISDFGEMDRLAAIARPDICVLTNIGQCHLENLGDLEGVLRAKTEIFAHMREDGFVCINGDDAMLASLNAVKGQLPIRFGLGRENRIYADQIRNHGLFGSEAVFHLRAELWTERERMFAELFQPLRDELKPGAAKGTLRELTAELPIKIPVPGGHMIYNALAAMCVGILSGLSLQEIKSGIEGLKAMKGRSNIIPLENGVLIDDCYNANPMSMKAALDLLQMAATRRVAILGDMLQLGSEERVFHEEVGRAAAACGIEVLIFIGSLAEYMYRAAGQTVKGKTIYYFADKESFMQKAGDILCTGDTVLLKASHGMAFETLAAEFQTNSLFLR